MRNIFPFQSKLSSDQRSRQMQQAPRLIWFTGLSGSGKSTLALRLEHHLFHLGFKVYLLDGDNLRSGLNSDLGFNNDDRKENIRRVGEVAKLMLDAGLIVICAFISPFEEERELVKNLVGEEKFTEVYVNCPLTICEARDTKGLYQKARKGVIADFTGISAPYEPPVSPCVEVQTGEESIDESVYKLINFIEPLLEVQEKSSTLLSEWSLKPEAFTFLP
ncbi:adenylyl-sulfate kinase [Pontibacter sp. KCTC 32443]|uniref:adenylyl-sulfate kinase n=1 Tax=Pontibacter TaxID=323449 RepID=UPI00164E6879|nr:MULTISPECIES: adenylyl-sulfate kinase [Pontibacter]MBC5774656.1 adenylyl-sulfate kinase [Pontibacter sp. KCTC 32443]